MLWSRKSAPIHDKARVVGIDLTATRARAVSVGGGKVRPLILNDPLDELLLFIAGDRRSPDVGRAGYMLARKLPHVVCSNFLPHLGQPHEWKAGRHVFTPESAVELTLAKVQAAVSAESEAAAVVLPAYLAPTQVAKLVAVAGKAKLPVKGTASALLALAADRSGPFLAGKPVVATDDWVVPLRPGANGPGAVVILDADEFALSAVVVGVERDAVRLLASACWPRAGLKAWKDRLLDSVADRCVRLCRRDPRDSADAEQALFEQLDDALDLVRAGQRVSLTVRTAHWYQDVIQQPDEFDGYCSALARLSAEGVRELVTGAALPLPPRAVWLTHAAGRLPGLAKAVHQNTPEATAVEVLPVSAVAHAAAVLVPRWLSGELPRQHVDTILGLSPEESGVRSRASGVGSRGSGVVDK